MKHLFRAALLAALCFQALAWTVLPVNASAPVEKMHKSLLVAALEVEIKDHTEAIMAWDPFSGTGPYHVGVYDLTEGKRFTNFTTVAIKANVEGLTPGHTYRFTVSRGVTTLTVDRTA